MSTNGSSTRNSGFLSTDLPLTSKRVRFILSNKVDSKKLAIATRAKKRGASIPFTLSSEVKDKI